MILEFPDFESIRIALTSDLIPSKIASSQVKYSTAGLHDESLGYAILVEFSGKVSRKQSTELRALGVVSRRVAAKHLVQVCCSWLALLPPIQVEDEVGDKSVVLFDIPPQEDKSARTATPMSDMVGEMLRLGNDRQSFRFVDDNGADRVLLRVVGPPFYSLLRAIDGNDAPNGTARPNSRRRDSPTEDQSEQPARRNKLPTANRTIAYLERSARVWIEFGFDHQLTNLITPPIGQMLLIDRHGGWRFIDEAPFRDIYQAIDLQLPRQPRPVTDLQLDQRLEVPLRLVRGGSSDHAELWVLAKSAVQQLDEFVSNADARLVRRFSFAVVDPSMTKTAAEPIVLLRARPSKEPAPVLILDALACASYLKLGNLFVPAGHRIHPPLRRDQVKRLLANDSALTTWLEPAANGSFATRTVDDSAFRPLDDWVDYVLDEASEVLSHWVQSSQFDFDSFVCLDEQSEWTEREKPTKKKRPKREAREHVHTDKDVENEEPTRDARVRPKKKAAKKKATGRPTRKIAVSELEKELRGLEQQYLAMESPLDDEGRRSLWVQMAQANSRLNQTSEASVCWGHVFWERPTEGNAEVEIELAQQWYESESRSWGHASNFLDGGVDEDALRDVLDQKNPTPTVVNSFASWLIWQSLACGDRSLPRSIMGELGRVQRFFEQFESVLSIRHTWLTWCALAKISGGDVLALARARDRILERLFQQGLIPDRDVPAFLRASGMASGDRFRVVRDQIVDLRDQSKAWCEKHRETSSKYTDEYVDLAFAYALARLGESRLARDIFDEAKEKLEKLDDKIHSWFAKAYGYRIEQALDGRQNRDSLPDELLQSVEDMRNSKDTTEKFACFKIDRLRQASKILEPLDTLNPFERYHQRFPDGFSRQLAEITEILDRSELAERISELLDSTTDSNQRCQLVNTALEVGPRLGETIAQDVLASALSVIQVLDDVVQRAELMKGALFLAAHFDLSEYVTALVNNLHDLLEAQRGTDVETVQALESLLAKSFPGMRKLGLRDSIGLLLQQMTSLVQTLAEGNPVKKLAKKNDALTESLKMLLQIASGWFYFGQEARAWEIIDDARAKLFAKQAELLIPVQQTQLACAYATALGQAPATQAIPRIGEMFKSLRGVKDSFTTNTHFSLSQIVVVESVLLAMVSEDFQLSESGRRWLDDDEYLIRRRIHQDVRAGETD